MTASFICLSANAALVILNWRVKHDVMTTTFISLGLLGSYAFGIWTALSVTRTTSQEMISVEGIQPFRAGFFEQLSLGSPISLLPEESCHVNGTKREETAASRSRSCLVYTSCFLNCRIIPHPIPWAPCRRVVGPICDVWRCRLRIMYEGHAKCQLSITWRTGTKVPAPAGPLILLQVPISLVSAFVVRSTHQGRDFLTVYAARTRNTDENVAEAPVFTHKSWE
jgi:hypothetical protein